MDVVGRKVENQVHFWSLLGPFFVLLSIAVLLFKASPHWYFPVSALIGIPLCVKWKMKGMAFALGCLFLFAGINFQGLELDDRYWHVGLALAMAFSFIVLTLSLEESQGLVNKVQLESQSRLDNFLLLDEKLKSTELERSIEREKAKNEIGTLTQELTRIHEDKQIFYKLAQLAKDELVQVRGQHDQLLQDLLYKKQQIAQLYERIEETEITIAGFVNSDGEKQIQILSERIASLEQEKEIFKAKIILAQEEGQTCQIEKERLTQELQFSKDCEKLHIAEQENHLKEKQEQQELIVSLQKQCALLEDAKNQLLVAKSNSEKLHIAEQENHRTEKQEQQELILSLQKQCALLEDAKNQLLVAKSKWEQQAEQARHLELQYQQSVEHSQRKLRESDARLQEIEAQKNALECIRDELDEKLHYFEKLAKQKEEQNKDALLQLQNQLEISKKNESNLILHYQEKENVLIHEKNLLDENCKSIQQDLIQAQRNLDVKNETLNEMQCKIEELNHQLNVQQSLYQLSSEQNQKLEILKSELEHALDHAKAESQLIVQKMALHSSHQIKNKDSTSSDGKRAVESMYKQLKEQFQEKCHVLDATRRELFKVNEELLKYQREYEEEHRFDQPSNERKLQRYIIRLGNQFEQMQENYQKEIDDLTQLVAQLLGQIKK